MTKVDLSKLKLPKPVQPEFGDDEVGKIAAFIFKSRRSACIEPYLKASGRRHNREIGGARKKTQAAWAKMVDRLRDDPNMISILDNAGLLDAINEASALVSEPYEPYTDTGGKIPKPHLILALWAADEFFPDWRNNPAAIINEALIRAGITKSDKTESVRVTLQNHKSSEKRMDWQDLLRKM